MEIPFPIDYRTTQNAHVFRNALRIVLQSMDHEVRSVVLATITKVVLRDDLINGEPDTVGAAWFNGVVEFRANSLQDLSEACGLVAHELRHVWQFATGFVKHVAAEKVDVLHFQVAMARAECEQDAVDYAESIGFPCPSRQLDNFKDCWAYFNQEQRVAFLRRAAEIRLQVRNPDWKEEN